MPKEGLAFARSLATLKCLPPSRQGWLHPKTQSWYPIWGLTPNRRSGNPSSVWRMSLLQSTSRHNSPPLSCFCRDSMIWTCLPSFFFGHWMRLGVVFCFLVDTLFLVIFIHPCLVFRISLCLKQWDCVRNTASPSSPFVLPKCGGASPLRARRKMELNNIVRERPVRHAELTSSSVSFLLCFPTEPCTSSLTFFSFRCFPECCNNFPPGANAPSFPVLVEPCVIPGNDVITFVPLPLSLGACELEVTFRTRSSSGSSLDHVVQWVKGHIRFVYKGKGPVGWLLGLIPRGRHAVKGANHYGREAYLYIRIYRVLQRKLTRIFVEILRIAQRNH